MLFIVNRLLPAVCVYVCVCACVRVRVRTCVRVYVCMCVCACVLACVYVCARARACCAMRAMSDHKCECIVRVSCGRTVWCAHETDHVRVYV